MTEKTITKADFRAHRKKLKLTQKKMAAELGISEKTVQKYEQKTSGIPVPKRLAHDPRFKHLAK